MWDNQQFNPANRTFHEEFSYEDENDILHHHAEVHYNVLVGATNPKLVNHQEINKSKPILIRPDSSLKKYFNEFKRESLSQSFQEEEEDHRNIIEQKTSTTIEAAAAALEQHEEKNSFNYFEENNIEQYYEGYVYGEHTNDELNNTILNVNNILGDFNSDSACDDITYKKFHEDDLTEAACHQNNQELSAADEQSFSEKRSVRSVRSFKQAASHLEHQQLDNTETYDRESYNFHTELYITETDDDKTNQLDNTLFDDNIKEDIDEDTVFEANIDDQTNQELALDSTTFIHEEEEAVDLNENATTEYFSEETNQETSHEVQEIQQENIYQEESSQQYETNEQHQFEKSTQHQFEESSQQEQLEQSNAQHFEETAQDTFYDDAHTNNQHLNCYHDEYTNDSNNNYYMDSNFYNETNLVESNQSTCNEGQFFKKEVKEEEKKEFVCAENTECCEEESLRKYKEFFEKQSYFIEDCCCNQSGNHHHYLQQLEKQQVQNQQVQTQRQEKRQEQRIEQRQEKRCEQRQEQRIEQSQEKRCEQRQEQRIEQSQEKRCEQRQEQRIEQRQEKRHEVQKARESIDQKSYYADCNRGYVAVAPAKSEKCIENKKIVKEEKASTVKESLFKQSDFIFDKSLSARNSKRSSYVEDILRDERLTMEAQSNDLSVNNYATFERELKAKQHQQQQQQKRFSEVKLNFSHSNNALNSFAAFDAKQSFAAFNSNGLQQAQHKQEAKFASQTNNGFIGGTASRSFNSLINNNQQQQQVTNQASKQQSYFIDSECCDALIQNIATIHNSKQKLRERKPNSLSSSTSNLNAKKTCTEMTSAHRSASRGEIVEVVHCVDRHNPNGYFFDLAQEDHSDDGVKRAYKIIFKKY